MLKNLFVFLCCICIAFKVNALPVNNNSLNSILEIQDQQEREQKLVSYIRLCLQDKPNDLISNKSKLDNFLNRRSVGNNKAIEYFTESIYQRELVHMDEAEDAIGKAIEYAGKNDDHFLMFTFLTHLAFIQTEEGNAIAAVTSYGLAKKEAVILDDPHLQIQIDVNLSDVYYKNNFYSQSLFYLDQAATLTKKYSPDDGRINSVIYYNKAENFFRMNKPDSLDKYSEKLKAINGKVYGFYTEKKRTEYYLYLLQYDFKRAIKQIKLLQNDGLYKFNDQDQLNLADAYFYGGQPDSAIRIINELLAQPLELNHPEIKYHLYKVLGQIAESRKNKSTAGFNYKNSLEQAESVISRLTQVGNISSQIKIDEIEGSYIQKDAKYERELLWLIFAVIVALLVIVIITMSYRTAHQKQHYEKLLFTAHKEELAFINSHEVRKHLSNILGIIDIIKSSEDKEKEYKQFEDHLFYSADSLDNAIKNISAKLEEQLPDQVNFTPSHIPKNAVLA
jgi:hypothetical protein